MLMMVRYFQVLDSEINGGDGNGVLSHDEFLARRQFPEFVPELEGMRNPFPKLLG